MLPSRESNDFVRVFIPLFVSKIELEEKVSQRTHATVNLDEMYPLRICPNDIANQLTQALNTSFMQVGSTLEETMQIVEQHNYKEYVSHVFAVQMWVERSDIHPFATFQQLCGIDEASLDEKYRVKQKAYSSLALHTKIPRCRLIQMELIFGDPKLITYKDPICLITTNTAEFDSHRHYDHNTALAKLKSFLHDQTFWLSQHTVISRSDFPECIIWMQKTVDHPRFTLESLKAIAEQQLPNKNLPTFFKDVDAFIKNFEKETIEFLECVRQANSIHDIAAWIDKLFTVSAKVIIPPPPKAPPPKIPTQIKENIGFAVSILRR